MTQDNTGNLVRLDQPVKFWIYWAMISTIAGMVVIWLGYFTEARVTNNILRALLFALVGAAIAGLQALLLRKRLPHLAWWVLVSGVAWSFGFTLLNNKMLDQFTGVLLGAVMGFFQWLVLSMSLRRSIWWVLASSLGWGMGYLVAYTYLVTDETDNLISSLVFTFLFAFIPAVIGGGTMAWLLRQAPRTEADKEPSRAA